MALFNVIKYNGEPDVFAWKYPDEELGTWTQLVVSESQEAVLFKGGEALDVFKKGTHTLETANVPILNKIINLPFGGKSPFTAEVWYVNKASSLDIKWGTPSPIQIQDPKFGLFIPVRSNGIFGIKISDSKEFLTKMVGTLPSFDKPGLVKFFRGIYITKVKDAISTYLLKRQISVLEINAYIDELSQFLKEQLMPVMSDYGIELVSFYVNDVSVPEDDTAVKKLKDALAKKAEMNILGYNYQQERSFDTMEHVAGNPGSISAPFMSAGMGLGMGTGFGNTLNTMAQSLNLGQESGAVCPNCHSVKRNDQRYCGTCGYDFANPIGHNQSQNCPECGGIIPVNARFCPECGKNITIACSKCGATMNGKSNFCPECGEKFI